jgi:para-nitrobenzyl esterase
MRRATFAMVALWVGCSSAAQPPDDAAAADAGTTAADDAAADDAAADDAAIDTGAPLCPVGAPGDPAVVALDTGLVRGIESGATRAFLGIPFAAPPVGDLRFRAPQPAACWTEVRDASAYGSACPQLDRDGAPIGDEDCLTLNVWTPTARPPEPLPILFFIHGGGNNAGSASSAGGDLALYDGEALASRGAVVITTEYRLGALGFLAHDDVPDANLGLLDQIAALAWVQRNAAALGGDPSRVMIFGESGGGLDVCMLLTSPLAGGLFSRALVQSGGCPGVPRTIALAAGARLVSGAGCDGPDPIGCLRGRTAAEILLALPQEVAGITGNDFGPFVDGTVLPRAPLEAIAAGEHHHVPFVLGTNADETARMVPPGLDSEAAYQAFARAYLAQYALSAAEIDRILALYPTTEHASIREAAVALTTDTRWTCPARAILRAIDDAQTEPVHRYFFTQRLDPSRAPMASALGAFHGLELAYVFGTLEAGGYRPTESDRALADAMQSSWVRFAATGDPGGSGAPPWPAYDATDPYLELGPTIAPGTGVRSARCDAIEAALASR